MYVESDYADDKEDRKSMSDFYAKIANATDLWGSRKQNNLDLSTCKADYCQFQLLHKNLYGFKNV